MVNFLKDPLLTGQGQPNLDPTAQTAAAPGAAPPPAPTGTAQTTSAPAAPGAAPAPWSVPPPPPMPPPPDFSGMNPNLQSFATDWMANPNRYLSDFAQASRAEMDARLRAAETDATRGIEEWAASRGVVGSQGAGMEGGQMGQLQEGLQRARLEEERALLEMLASAETLDRQSAGNFGLDLARFGEDAIQGRESLAIERERLAQQGALTEREIESRERMFGEELTQRESEFARSIGLDERQFQAQQDQFAQDIALRREALAQENEQFRITLEDTQAARTIDTDLRTRALELQEKGLDADAAYREAALSQERELAEAAQALQLKGMEADDAYRYAALEQDAGFRERALELQKEGLDADAAYRQADLEFRQERAKAEDEFRDTYAYLEALKVLSGEGLSEEGLALLQRLFPELDLSGENTTSGNGNEDATPTGGSETTTEYPADEGGQDTSSGEKPSGPGTYEGETRNGYVWYNGQWI